MDRLQAPRRRWSRLLLRLDDVVEGLQMVLKGTPCQVPRPPVIHIYLCDDEEAVLHQIQTALEWKIFMENYDRRWSRLLLRLDDVVEGLQMVLKGSPRQVPIAGDVYQRPVGVPPPLFMS